MNLVGHDMQIAYDVTDYSYTSLKSILDDVMLIRS